MLRENYTTSKRKEKMFSIFYVDPPWDYKGQTQHHGSPKASSASKHYNCLKFSDLAAMDIDYIADDDALMFLWTSSPHLNQAIKLLESWGFKYTTVGFVWDKKRSNPGYYTMSQCELCIIGKKGKIPQPRGARNIKQFFSEKRTTHSTKPAEIRKRIELMFPQHSKVELFARNHVNGWTCIGDTLGMKVEDFIQNFKLNPIPSQMKRKPKKKSSSKVSYGNTNVQSKNKQKANVVIKRTLVRNTLKEAEP
jgi:N6-adenosine-specific RNA methylase IME4